MIRRMGLAAVLAAAVLAAGCGSSGIEGDSSTKVQTVPAADGPPSGELTISQWPLYVDPGKNGTVAEYERKTGVDVKWTEDINDNVEFFGKMQPLLSKGESGGRSMITVSDWLARQMYDLGYLEKLDYSQLPNVKRNLIPALRHPSADPNREFTVPWQSGMTGLIVNKDLAPDVNSICDLFDPKYAGKVDMLTELRDTVPMTLKCMGIDPDKATTEQWLCGRGQDQGGGRLGADPPLHRQRLHPRPLLRRRRLRAGLVGRRGAAPERQPEHPVRDAEGGLHAVVHLDGDPGRRPQPAGGGVVHELRLRPEGAGRHRGVGELRHSGEGREADPRQARPGAGEEPAHLPLGATPRTAPSSRCWAAPRATR